MINSPNPLILLVTEIYYQVFCKPGLVYRCNGAILCDMSTVLINSPTVVSVCNSGIIFHFRQNVIFEVSTNSSHKLGWRVPLFDY